MRALVQRVREAEVEAEGRVTGRIGRGMLVFLAIAKGDTRREADYLRDKLAGLRIFADEQGKMNLNLRQAGGAMLVVSQFTLYGDCTRGLRPSFDRAAAPEQARELYRYFIESARAASLEVESGVFQAHMLVRIVNDGPVTVICDSLPR
ncbi:MAG: D-tyrosyl-tRNA(Tyr) deacylase [Acidobacteria bacterium]|nr:D-tyrosyl-tRNA(Tyr) deacylase [Acidobacteriota bacterium]